MDTIIELEYFQKNCHLGHSEFFSVLFTGDLLGSPFRMLDLLFGTGCAGVELVAILACADNTNPVIYSGAF